MALIKCSECGNEISDMAITCPKCGCPIVSENNRLNDIPNENVSKSKGGNKKKIIALCGGIAAVVIIIGIVFLVSSIKKKNNYEDAMRLMDDGEIDEAYELFNDLGDYRESEKYATDLYNKITYEEAMQYINEGEFDKGIDMLYEISDYEEAKETLAQMVSKYDNVSDKTYYCGMVILSLFNDEGFEQRVGKKMKSTMDTKYGDEYDKVATSDIVDVLKKEDYIASMVDTINALPSSSTGDEEFKDIIMDLYKMKMDGIYANYVAKVDDNCTSLYKLYLYSYGFDEDFYDLYKWVNVVQNELDVGDSSTADIVYVTGVMSGMTMFSDIDE